jgi:hypothetical protein
MPGLVPGIHVILFESRALAGPSPRRSGFGRAGGSRPGHDELNYIAPFVGCSAALRKQSRHRQSSPSTGIGNRAVSMAHQQSPPGLQENSVPQREQARRRGESVRSFMTTL